MAHIKTSIKGENASNQSRLLYGLHDKPPLKESLFTALQHVFASFIPTVTPGLLVTGALGLDPKAAAYLLGMSLFVSGLGTFIQVFQPGFIGSGLLSVQGTSFAFVTPMLAVVAENPRRNDRPDFGAMFFWFLYSDCDESVLAPDAPGLYSAGDRHCGHINWAVFG